MRFASRSRGMRLSLLRAPSTAFRELHAELRSGCFVEGFLLIALTTQGHYVTMPSIAIESLSERRGRFCCKWKYVNR